MRDISKVFLFILLGVWTNSVFALRCGNQIISVGDAEAKVLLACGQPSQKSESNGSNRNHQNSKKSQPYNYKNYKTTQTMRWFYNFGPTDFIYVVVFKNGKVNKIETKGYGYRK